MNISQLLVLKTVISGSESVKQFLYVFLMLELFTMPFLFPFAALNLSQRTSTTAFDTKIKIKIQLGELEEALELANEWRMLDPEVRPKNKTV